MSDNSKVAEASYLRDELPVGEEIRCDPFHTDFSTWLRGGIASLPIQGPPLFPASFDRSVWPRPEDVEPGEVSITVIERPRNILELFPIQTCDKTTPDGNWRIGATLLTNRGTIARAVTRSLEPEIKPMLNNWTLMGYDVVDSGLAISGLLNCGAVAIEIAKKLLADRAMLLTQFYLWPFPEIAESYASQLDQVIQGHAPFEVVGLYFCQGESSSRID